MLDDATTETGEETTPAPAAETTPVEEPKTFSAEYVKELREEAAAARVENKRFKEAFNGYEPEAVDAWLGLAATYREDPKAGATEMKALVEEVLADQKDEGVERGDAEYLTPAQVEKMIKEQLSVAEVAAAQRELEADARALGYTTDEEDEDYVDYLALCRFAKNKTDGNLDEAHKLMLARDQRRVDKYLESKAADAGKTPKAPVANGAAASQEKDLGSPQTEEDVIARAVARLEAANSEI